MAFNRRKVQSRLFLTGLVLQEQEREQTALIGWVLGLCQEK